MLAKMWGSFWPAFTTMGVIKKPGICRACDPLNAFEPASQPWHRGGSGMSGQVVADDVYRGAGKPQDSGANDFLF